MSAVSPLPQPCSPPRWAFYTLKPGEEWFPRVNSWCLLRMARGTGYWLAPGCHALIEAGSVLFAQGDGKNCLRASQIACASFGYCLIDPTGLELLAGREAANDLITAWRHQDRGFLHCGADEPLALEIGRQGRGRRGVVGGHLPAKVIHWFAQGIHPEGEVVGLKRPPAAQRGFPGLSAWLAGMDRHEACTLSVAEMARRYHCSCRHLGRLFRREFGVAVRRQQIIWRMEIARALLTDERLRVVDVARKSGYRNLGLFNATFKIEHGMTPSRWRRKALVDRQRSNSDELGRSVSSGFSRAPSVHTDVTLKPRPRDAVC